MFQEFLIKLSKKNKIIIVLFIGSIFLIFFTLSKKDKKQYYQNKIEKLQQLNQNNQFKKDILGRYQQFLDETQEEEKWVLDLPLEKINENLSKVIQNSKIKVLAEQDNSEEYEDFSLGQKQLQIQASYKNLNQFIVDLKKINIWISAIKINNTAIYSKNPQLDVVISIHYAFSHL